MNHNAKTRFRITFGFLGLIGSIFNRSLKVVFFNFGRDIKGGVKGGGEEYSRGVQKALQNKGLRDLKKVFNLTQKGGEKINV